MSRVYPCQSTLEPALKQYLQDPKVPELDKPKINEFIQKQGGLGVGPRRLIKILDTLRRNYRLMPGFSVVAATEETLLELGERIRRSRYSDNTKRDSFVVLRRYYKVMEGRNAHYPEKLDYFKAPGNPGPTKGPADVISRLELDRMLEATKTGRDKALLMLLYEGGLRVGELCSLDVKDVVVVDDGVDVHIPDKPECKSGPRDIWLTESVGRIQDYLSTYKFRGQPDKPFFLQVALE